MLTDFLISYHFLIIILQRSPKYFPLLPDFSNPLSFIPIRVRSTLFCYRTSYHIITFRRSLRYLYAYRLLILIILSFPKVRSTCTCSRTLLLSYPLGLSASFAAGPPSSGPRYLVCFSDVFRHQSEVLCVLWTVVMVSGLKYCPCCWINVSPSGPKYYLCSRMSVKLSIP